VLGPRAKVLIDGWNLKILSLGTSRTCTFERGRQATSQSGMVRHVFDLAERQTTERLLIGVQKLHLGCGSRHFAGWANIDFAGPRGTIRWNLTRPIPARSNSIYFIYSEHFIEHITRSEAALLLKNCFDLLVPGGVIRISTPNLRFLVEQYCSGCVEEWRDVQWTPATPAQMYIQLHRLRCILRDKRARDTTPSW
jgi:predicted SAM-dependent methyltransferase